MLVRRRFLMVLLFSISLLWPAWGSGQTPSLEQVLSKVQERYEAHSDFKAHFSQETLVKSIGKKQRAEGEVYFKKPGKMRWIYRQPNRQEIISDGKNFWNYRPEEKQVIVSRMAQAFQSKAPSTFLAGLGNLKRDFRPRFAREPSPGKDYSLELTPVEPQGSLEKLFLEIDPKSFKIVRAKIQDAMGNVTEIGFSKIQFDNRLPDSLFTFTPPPGVEVFHMPGSAPAGTAG